MVIIEQQIRQVPAIALVLFNKSRLEKGLENGLFPGNDSLLPVLVFALLVHDLRHLERELARSEP